MHEYQPGCMSGPALLHGQAVVGLSVVALQLLVSCAEQSGGGWWLLAAAVCYRTVSSTRFGCISVHSRSSSNLKEGATLYLRSCACQFTVQEVLD